MLGGIIMLVKQIDVKKGVKKLSANIFRYLFFICVAYVLLYPILYMISNSIKNLFDTYDATVIWVPKNVTFENFVSAFTVFHIDKTLLNTIIYEIVAALIQFCSCAVAAYGIARFKFKGKNLMLILMLATMLVPSMMLIIPNYVNFSRLDFLGIFGIISKIVGKEIRPNIVNTVWAFYLPSALGVGLKGGLFIYIFSQFYKGLPKELEEAAEIDGAGAWRTFLNIVLPSSGSAIITVLLFSIVWHWNDYHLAQMYAVDNPTFAVQLNNFGQNTVSAELSMDISQAILLSTPILLAGCLLFIIPLVIFYILVQRKFMASIARTGLVG